MIAFVEAKRPDYAQIQRLLAASESSGVWSNFGPLSLRLEAEVLTLLAAAGLPPRAPTAMCSPGCSIPPTRSPSIRRSRRRGC